MLCVISTKLIRPLEVRKLTWDRLFNNGWKDAYPGYGFCIVQAYLKHMIETCRVLIPATHKAPVFVPNQPPVRLIPLAGFLITWHAGMASWLHAFRRFIATIQLHCVDHCFTSLRKPFSLMIT